MWENAINNATTLPALTAALRIPDEELIREVIELQDWIRIINVLDCALEVVLRSHSDLVLLWDKGGPPKPRPVPSDFAGIGQSIAQVTLERHIAPMNVPVSSDLTFGIAGFAPRGQGHHSRHCTLYNRGHAPRIEQASLQFFGALVESAWSS